MGRLVRARVVAKTSLPIEQFDERLSQVLRQLFVDDSADIVFVEGVEEFGGGPLYSAARGAMIQIVAWIKGRS